MIIMGIDPGLTRTGWGFIRIEGFRLRLISHGAITSTTQAPIAERLAKIGTCLEDAIEQIRPSSVAIEEVFVNRDGVGSLKLGMARGVALMVAGRAGLDVTGYQPNVIKRAVTGFGRADKEQIYSMIQRLLSCTDELSFDEADALAAAICHAHNQPRVADLVSSRRS